MQLLNNKTVEQLKGSQLEMATNHSRHLLVSSGSCFRERPFIHFIGCIIDAFLTNSSMRIGEIVIFSNCPICQIIRHENITKLNSLFIS